MQKSTKNLIKTQNNYLNHKKNIQNEKKIERTRFQFTPRRIGGVTVVGNGEGGATDSSEQWHRAMTTFVRAQWWLFVDGGAIGVFFACCSMAEQYR